MKKTGNLNESFKGLRNTMVLIIVATVAMGLIYFFSPLSAMKVVGYVMASALCLWGVYIFVEYFVRDENIAFGSYGLVKGLAAVLIGILIFSNIRYVSYALSFIVGISMIIDGLAKAQYSIDLLRLKAKNWWWLFIPAALILVLGIIIACNPRVTTDGFKTFIGISLVLDAATDIFSILFISRKLKQVEKSKETALVKTEEEE